MKKFLLVASLVAMLAVAPVAALDWIVAPIPAGSDSQLMIYGGYGTWFFFDMAMAGGVYEIKLADRLALGVEANWGLLRLGDIYGPGFDYSFNMTNLGVYAKYEVFTPDDMLALVNFPVGFGVAAGVDYALELVEASARSGDEYATFAATATGFGVMASIYCYYPLDANLFVLVRAGVNAKVAAIAWVFDSSEGSVSGSGDAASSSLFDYDVSLVWRYDEGMSFTVFWVPLVGIGASVTLVL